MTSTTLELQEIQITAELKGVIAVPDGKGPFPATKIEVALTKNKNGARLIF